MSALWQSCCAVLPTAEELSKNEETFGCAESPKTGTQAARKGFHLWKGALGRPSRRRRGRAGAGTGKTSNRIYRDSYKETT
jgi:hypothetical protein